MSLSSGVGVRVDHFDGETVREIIIGLMEGDQTYTLDGMPLSYEAHAVEHIKNYLESVFPTTVKISHIFPREVYDENGEILGDLQLPYVAIRVNKGPSKEVGIGGILWDGKEGTVLGFNQIMYIEFDIFDTNMMKVAQIGDHISSQLQWQKRIGGVLWEKGFQNFETVQSESARGFRYDTAWDFRMQHQYADLFHTRMTVRTRFDVVWLNKLDSRGVISMIVFGQTDDLPFSTFIGASLGYLRLEELYYGWHGKTLLY